MSLQERQTLTLRGIFKALGPGILYAGAAIGASHLVLSTQAGASYSYKLIWAIILINLFKYPFFEFTYRYTASTGKSVLDGYRKLGKWAIISFFLLSVCTGIVNFAAVTKVTADLATYLFHLQLSPFATSTGLLSIILLMLFFGRYAFLDSIMKLMIGGLAIFTIIAFFFALSIGANVEPGFVPPPLWDTAAITFLIALMGWMPTPIECSAWTSIWAVERNKQMSYKPTFREYHIDFHIGYIGSAVMAIFFLGLGALIMYGTGEIFSSNGVVFSQQLVSLYSGSIGNWSTPIIAFVVLITMMSTALTVIDGYPRSLEGSLLQIFPSLKMFGRALYLFWIVILSVTAVLIIVVFTKNMGSLLKFATILSFLAAPLFAIINYKVVTSWFFPVEAQPKRWLRILGITGIAFLILFCLLYLYFVLF
ncbi:MAG: Nramp family divalent metal transporter [Bacteroidia bacterium]|nr:Nramp family divalent metal transporter [Bacteroidia bacterium]